MLSPDNPTINGKVSGETIKVLENSFIEEFLPQVIEKRTVVEVIDKDGNTSGYITEKRAGSVSHQKLIRPCNHFDSFAKKL